MKFDLLYRRLMDGIANTLGGLRNRHFFFLDLILFCVTPLLALTLRSDSFGDDFRYLEPLAIYTLVALTLRIGVFGLTGIYTHYWRFASIDEVWQLTISSVTATLLILLLFFGILRPTGILVDSFPRLIPLLDGVLALVGVGGLRFSVRLTERMRQQRQRFTTPRQRVGVIGAGEAGAMIVREMQSNPQLGLEPVAFLDDDPKKHRALIHGVPVLGDRSQIGMLKADCGIERVIIAMPTAPGKMIREIAGLCREAGLGVKTVPGMYELLGEHVKVDRLRDVDISDLLRRAPVVTDTAAVEQLLRGKRVMVTGAGGSIGGELCRQIARCEPACLVLLGHGENSLYHQSNELAALFPDLRFAVVVADVRDAKRIHAVLEREQSQIIFHAAAHKHVPMMESNVEDAVTNNVLGTRTMLNAACAHKVEHFVLVSTDKAVHPVSVMGATKRVAELLVREMALESGRCFVAVRFGNVLGSRGSVVPFFKEQIARGGPITVTHPDVVRFFMTIPEAVQLVLQAATLGKGGEVFALDMGEPIRIVDLAQDMIRLSGLEVGRDIDIVFTGLRPGEKMYEELFVPGEKYARTRHEKIYAAQDDAVPIADFRERTWQYAEELIGAASKGDTLRVRTLLGVLVPEFQAGVGAKPEVVVG